jgi:hypothetical protein
MLIRRLILENFSLFRGRNELDLVPRPRQGRGLIQQLDESRSGRDRLRQEIAREEQGLARAGGAFANRRQALQAERDQLQEQVKGAEADLRELSESFLPFTLVSPPCRLLQGQLQAEAKVQAWHAQEALIQSRLGSMRSTIEATLFPEDEPCDLDCRSRKKMAKRVAGWLQQPLQPFRPS